LAASKCDCGCELPLLQQLEGRVTDLLVRPDGATVAGIMLVDMFLDKPEIEHLQIIQEDLQHVHILLVPSSQFNPEVEKFVVAELREHMGMDIGIAVEKVPEIPRNPRSGKFQEVICRVDAARIN